MAVTPVCVAVKAHMGWLNAVAVDQADAAITPVLASRIVLFADHGREIVEPYHVAGGWDGLERAPVPPDPAAVVARARRVQDALAAAALNDYRNGLEALGCRLVRAIVLTGRGRLGDLNQMLGSHAQIHVAEGEAVRDAARAAFAGMRVECQDQDEKSVLTASADKLAHNSFAATTDMRQGSLAPDELMKARRPGGSRTWTKEERLLGLAAWLNR